MNRTVEDKLLDSINNIQSTIGEKDQLLWKSQAIAKCYAEASEDINRKSDVLRKQISKTEAESKELQPLIGMLDESYETQRWMSRLIFQSILVHRSYKKLLEKIVKEREDERDRIKNEYDQQFQNIKEKLQKTNPMYQMVHEKRCELKKCQIRCRLLESKIVQNRTNLEKKKMAFYEQFVSLARRWLAKRDHLRMVQEVSDLKKQEVELIKKVTETQENLKKKQETAYTRRDSTYFDPMKLQKALKEQSQGLKKGVVDSQANNMVKLFSKPTCKSENMMKDLQNLIDQSAKEPKTNIVLKSNKITPPVTNDDHQIIKNKLQNLLEHPSENLTTKGPAPPMQKTALDISSKPLVKQADPSFIKTNFNADGSKVKILENKVLVAPQAALKPTALNKKERSKIIEDKLQKVMQKMAQKKSKKSRYFQNSLSKCFSSDVSQQEAIPVLSEANENQHLENIFSQEESEMKFVTPSSQPCASNTQGVPSKVEPTPKIVSNSQVDNCESNAVMNFQGDVQNKTIFRKPETAPSMMANSFMMNFRGADTMSVMNPPSNKISSSAPLSLNAAFKRNGNDDVHMSVPSNSGAQDRAFSGILQNDEKHDINLVSQGINNQINFGDTQYDFGNMDTSQVGEYNEYEPPFLKSPPDGLSSNFQMPMSFGNFGNTDTTEKPFSFNFMKC